MSQAEAVVLHEVIAFSEWSNELDAIELREPAEQKVMSDVQQSHRGRHEDEHRRAGIADQWAGDTWSPCHVAHRSRSFDCLRPAVDLRVHCVGRAGLDPRPADKSGNDALATSLARRQKSGFEGILAPLGRLSLTRLIPRRRSSGDDAPGRPCRVRFAASSRARRTGRCGAAGGPWSSHSSMCEPTGFAFSPRPSPTRCAPTPVTACAAPLGRKPGSSLTTSTAADRRRRPRAALKGRRELCLSCGATISDNCDLAADRAGGRVEDGPDLHPR